MNTSAKHTIQLVSMLFLFPACVKEISLEKSNEYKALVINAIANPNEALSVRLSQTLQATSSDKGLISNAEVQLFENEQYITTLANNGNGMYTSSLKPVAGKNYKILAIGDGFPVASAAEYIPQKIDLSGFTFKYIGKVYSEYDNYDINCIEAFLSFKDPPDQKNYYELIFISKGNSKDPGTYLLPLFFDHPVLMNEGDASYRPYTYFFSDELFDGTDYTMNLKLSFLGGTKNGVLNPDDYYVSFRSVSYNYYMYRKIWTRHKYNQPSKIIFWEDILKGEPIDMFTNVENGYGIFAGYTSDEKSGTFIP